MCIKRFGLQQNKPWLHSIISLCVTSDEQYRFAAVKAFIDIAKKIIIIMSGAITDSPDPLLESCERIRSREARASLDRLVWRPLRSRGLGLSPYCPLASENDILRAQEDAKLRLSDRHWKCRLCGKNFVAEQYLDKHLARRHPWHRFKDESSHQVCFADFCGVAVPCFPLSNDRFLPISTAALKGMSPSPTYFEDNRPESALFPVDLAHYHAHDKFCNDSVERAARKHGCLHIIHQCITIQEVSCESDLVAIQTKLYHALCDDAQRIECLPRVERRQILLDIEADSEFSIRHFLGWVLLAALILLLAISRLLRWLQRCDRRIARKGRYIATFRHKCL